MFHIAHVEHTPTTTAEPVARAAAWLDTVKPGWARLVNPDTLDLHSSRSCILGQVFDAEARAQMGVVHTGYAYVAYSGLVSHAGLQSVNGAVFAYNDPYRADWIAAIQARV